MILLEERQSDRERERGPECRTALVSDRLATDLHQSV